MPNGYLISYDICHARRLQRVHRLLRSQATALLESLFVFQGTREQLEQLRTQLTQEIRAGEDELLIYALRSDRPIHRWGTACSSQGVYDFSLPPLIERRVSCIWTPNG